MRDAISSNWPTCAVCQRSVEWLCRYDDPASNTVIFVVECHGARQLMRWRLADLANLDGPFVLTGGIAFVAPKLTAEHP